MIVSLSEPNKVIYLGNFLDKNSCWKRVVLPGKTKLVSQKIDCIVEERVCLSLYVTDEEASPIISIAPTTNQDVKSPSHGLVLSVDNKTTVHKCSRSCGERLKSPWRCPFEQCNYAVCRKHSKAKSSDVSIDEDDDLQPGVSWSSTQIFDQLAEGPDLPEFQQDNATEIWFDGPTVA